MSQKSSCYFGGIMIISFVAPMVFVVLLMEWLGIGEYVFPIMIPIFLGLGAFILILTGVLTFAIRTSTRQRLELETSIAHTYEAEMFVDDGFREPKNSGAVYIVPTYCPYCQAAIGLSTVRWKTPMSLTCSSCGNSVDVRISEDDLF